MTPAVERISRTEVVVAWPKLGIGCAFSRLRESDAGVIRAELTVHSTRPDCPGILGGPTLIELLRSGPEVQRQATALANRTDGAIPWLDYLTSSVRHVLEEWRKPPEPVEWAEMEAPAPDSLFLFDKFIPRNQTTALMADQRSGKSTLGLGIAIATITGLTLPCGWKTEATGPVLYLDWETDQNSIYGMLTELQNGLRLRDRPRGFYYLQMNGPLVNQEQAIQSLVGRLKPILVIIDSLGWAAGGDLNKTEVAIPTMGALASLNCTRLVLAHYAKGSRVNGGPAKASIFGSGFFEFACRAIWELRKESDAGSAFNIGMYNAKLSRGQEGASMAVRLAFDSLRNAVEVLPARIEDSPELANKQPLATRIRELLRSGPMDTNELAEAVNIGRDVPVKAETVRRTLNRMPDAGPAESSQGGSGKRQLWIIGQPGHRDSPYRNTYVPVSLPLNGERDPGTGTEVPGQTGTERSLSRFPIRQPYADDVEELPL